MSKLRGRGPRLRIPPGLALAVASLLLAAPACAPGASGPRAATAAASGATPPDDSLTTGYASFPLILESAIADIHEGPLNGPVGYAYFSHAPAPKTGDLPRTLGGESGWGLDVWASNFQGPVRVEGESARIQWEWTADGEEQVNDREPYPFVYGRLVAADPEELAERAYPVLEHDDGGWWNPWSGDDRIGSVVIDHGACREEVFDRGKRSGWTGARESRGLGDVLWVRYRLHCTAPG